MQGRGIEYGVWRRTDRQTEGEETMGEHVQRSILTGRLHTKKGGDVGGFGDIRWGLAVVMYQYLAWLGDGKRSA
jgi:hypothetical protein